MLVITKMKKKGAKKAQIFKEGWIVILAILKKMRLFVKPKQLPVRILNINKQLYILISCFGRIKGGF
jgi:hypothetical protein